MRSSIRGTGFFVAALFIVISVLLPGTAAVGADQQDEMIVTGSRIGRTPGTYVGPMTVVEGDSLTAIPTYSLGDALTRLPSIGSQGTNRNNSNAGRGAEFRDIHNLEPERTLVLYNGRRSVATIRDSLGLAVDFQTFPVNAVNNVEILADGASAIYGSDAIAGVINIQGKREFEGVEFNVGAGTPSDSGGTQYNAGVLFGVTGGRGFFTLGTTYVHTDDIDFQQRDWAKDPILGQIDGGGGQVLSLFGSGIPPQGRVFQAFDIDGSGVVDDDEVSDIIFEPNPNTGESFQDYDTFCLGPQLDGSTGDGSIDCIKNQNHRFNYNKIDTGSSLINESNVYNVSASGEYNFKNGVTGYVDTLFAHREGHLNFTPLPISGAHGRFTDMIPVPLNNPNIPADALARIQMFSDPTATSFQMDWRGLDAGARQFDYDSDTFQNTLGLKGDFDALSRNWDWDTWFTAGRSELFEVTHGQVNVARLRTAVDPAACAADADCPKVTADNAADFPNLALGDPTISIFGRNSFSEEQSDWILFDDQEETDYEMYHLAATIATDLFEMDAGTVEFAGGLEWRKESGSVQTSGVVQAGDSGGNFAEPTSGDYNLWEAYGEFSLPLFTDALTLDAALRYSDYDSFGSETTYKAALTWRATDWLSVRGVNSTGFRAPNVLELFGGAADNFLFVSDPCSAPITGPERAGQLHGGRRTAGLHPERLAAQGHAGRQPESRSRNLRQLLDRRRADPGRQPAHRARLLQCRDRRRDQHAGAD